MKSKQKFASNKTGKPRKHSGKSGYKPTPQPEHSETHPSSDIERNSWDLYAFDEKMAADVASIPFNLIPGNPVAWNNNIAFSDDAGKTSQNFPGVLVLQYTMCPGTSTDATSGINMAARQLYSAIRRQNSGAKNYEAPDLMLYILAMEEIYTEYFEIRRLYACLNTYNYVNRYQPKLLMYALCNGDVDVTSENIAQHRYELNLIREKINSMAVPNFFKSFQRRVTIASQIFQDSTSARSGIYAYRKQDARIYQPTKYESGGCLALTDLEDYELDTDGRDALFARIRRLKAMVEAVITDDDMNLMSGDIIKAFGTSGLYSVADVSEDLRLTPIYDEDILAQIENSRIIPHKYVTNYNGYHSGDIYQKNNVLYFTPLSPTLEITSSTDQSEYGSTLLAANTQCFVNSHKDDPKYTDILEWTRNIGGFKSLPRAAANGQGIIDCGLELLLRYTLYAYTEANTSGVTFYHFTTFNNFKYTSAASDTAIKVLSMLSQFDWHPGIFHYSIEVFEPSISFVSMGWVTQPAMDFKVYTTMSQEVLARMNDLATYSCYYGKGLY